MIEIDDRETALYEHLQTLVQAHNQQQQKDHHRVLLTKKVLLLGDVLIRHPDDSDPFLIVERKTFQDLLASIKDGRYQEQSHRLIHSSGVHRHHIFYLIEGIPSQTNAKDLALIYSTITSLNMYKGFSIYRTAHYQESGEFLLALTNKVIRNAVERNEFPIYWKLQEPASSAAIESPSSYCTVVKKEKKENITPQNIGEIILCQIPGISSISAQAIMAKYGTIRALLEDMISNNECLFDVYLETSGQKRKISRTVVENVRKYLVGE